VIANIANALIGLWLAYVSVFGMAAPLHKPWAFALAGLTIAGLAQIASRRGYPGWQSATNFVVGLVLFVMALAGWAIPISPLVIFWISLWAGLIVSSLALWAVLYRLEQRSDLSMSKPAD
jgi:hypothetical protein